jgi:hypothetical protein
MYLATGILWRLPYVGGNVFHGGLCSMHKSAERVKIGRNCETENPIGPQFLAWSRKKQPVTPLFFHQILKWCLQ